MEKDLLLGAKGEGKWMRLEEFLQWGKLESEEKFTGEQVHESIMLCYSSGTTGLSKGVEVSFTLAC